jgi:hypothetical protein
MNGNSFAGCFLLILAIARVTEALAEGNVSVELISSFSYYRNYTTSDGIANDGTTVGTYEPSSGIFGYVRGSKGVFSQSISFPGAAGTYAKGVNTSGVICGFFSYPGTYASGFFYDGVTYTQYNVPNAVETLILGANDEGDFVGSYANPTYATFLNHNGRLETFVIPGADFTEAFGINNRGEIVGTYYLDGKSHGFFRQTDGTLIFPLDYAGATSTFLHAINDQEAIVGRWTDATTTHGLILELPDAFTSFDYPDSTFTYIGGINDKGFITGAYNDVHGRSRGFVAKVSR